MASSNKLLDIIKDFIAT